MAARRRGFKKRAMLNTKERALAQFPSLTEKVVTRLVPVGRKGFCALKNRLQIWDGGRLLCEENTTRAAYKAAKRILKIK